jgi:hypothetical protein
MNRSWLVGWSIVVHAASATKDAVVNKALPCMPFLAGLGTVVVCHYASWLQARLRPTGHLFH